MLLDLFKDFHGNFAETLDVWKPEGTQEESRSDKMRKWLNLDPILWSAVGSGFIALRDQKELDFEKEGGEMLDKIDQYFLEGMNFGFKQAISEMEESIRGTSKMFFKD